jgi:hypothetical protein
MVRNIRPARIGETLQALGRDAAGRIPGRLNSGEFSYAQSGSLRNAGNLARFREKNPRVLAWLNSRHLTAEATHKAFIRYQGGAVLAILRQLKCFCIANFSRPASERCLYRAIRRAGVASIVEVGVGSAQRALRMIEVAAGRGQSVRYTGIDEFESRSADRGAGLTLKQAYQRLRTTEAAIQLVPGDPLAALARAANSLTGTDLLVVSADVQAQSLRSAWRYVPRMLHRQSLVYLEETDSGGGRRFVRLSAGEINRLAESHQAQHRKAA